MIPVTKGTLQPLEQRFTETYSPTSGYTRELQWSGLSRGLMQQYANYYAAHGCEYHLDVVHGTAHLTATDNTLQVAIDTWEIGMIELPVSSLKNPRNLAAISAADLSLIARAMRDGRSLSEGDPPLESDAALRLYHRILEGSDSFFHYQYVLRHTTNVGNRYSRNVADLNVGHIYTTAQLLSEVTNPLSWIFPLPGRLQYKILNFEVPAAVDDYLWGWLKSGSPESGVANNRVNIVTEYKLFQWSTDEYDVV